MIPEYHKIQTIYCRDARGVIQPGEWARPEIGYLSGLQWSWTEKVDGTNIRIGYDEAGVYCVGGRTDAAQIPDTLIAAIDAYGLNKTICEHFDGPVTLYGEGYGARIQKGGGNYNPAGQDFVLFDVNVGGWWLDRESVEDVGRKLGLRVVPLAMTGTIADAESVVSAGFDSEWGPFRAEGLVGTPLAPLFNRKRERIIVKMKTKDYADLARRGSR